MKTTERSFTDLCGEQRSVCPYLLKVKGCRALFDFINKQMSATSRTYAEGNEACVRTF